MGKGLNNDERNQAILMLNAGMSATVVSWHLGCVYGENVADCPRSGLPRVTTAADDRYISSCSTYVTGV